MRGVEGSESSPDPSARQVRSSSVRCLRIGGGIRGNVGLPRFWRLVDGRIGEDSWFCSRLVALLHFSERSSIFVQFCKIKISFFFLSEKSRIKTIVVLIERSGRERFERNVYFLLFNFFLRMSDEWNGYR